MAPKKSKSIPATATNSPLIPDTLSTSSLHESSKSFWLDILLATDLKAIHQFVDFDLIAQRSGINIKSCNNKWSYLLRDLRNACLITADNKPLNSTNHRAPSYTSSSESSANDGTSEKIKTKAATARPKRKHPTTITLKTSTKTTTTTVTKTALHPKKRKTKLHLEKDIENRKQTKKQQKVFKTHKNTRPGNGVGSGNSFTASTPRNKKAVLAGLQRRQGIFSEPSKPTPAAAPLKSFASFEESHLKEKEQEHHHHQDMTSAFIDSILPYLPASTPSKPTVPRPIKSTNPLPSPYPQNLAYLPNTLTTPPALATPFSITPTHSTTSGRRTYTPQECLKIRSEYQPLEQIKFGENFEWGDYTDDVQEEREDDKGLRALEKIMMSGRAKARMLPFVM